MSERDLTTGKWFRINSQVEFDHVVRHGDLKQDFAAADVTKGSYDGPGRYRYLSYQQRCPRNCCNDTVHELLTAIAFAKELEDAMEELRVLHREAEWI